jgi:hypothetical protein
MANLPESEQIDLLTCEIYDESSYRDATLIWLFPEEELHKLDQPAESFKSFSVDSQDASRPEAMPLDGPLKEQPGILPGPAHHQSSNPEVRLLLLNSSEGDGSFGIPIASSPLTYKPPAQYNLTRWLFRVAALVGILLIGSVLPSILEHMRPARVKAFAAVGGPSTGIQSALSPRSGVVRVLTVMAGREETVKDLSLRYVGHFDDDLFEEIRKLNPDLKDPDHLEDGQLIRIPLRALPRLID